MIITLTTDFGLQDSFVGIMKGVIAAINPQVTVVDLTHGVPAHNILAGALTLRHAVDYFPPGTIHVAVVDPGVGSARLPLLIQCPERYLIGPDNGLLSLAVGDREPTAVVCLSNPEYHLKPTSATFHGRDIFAAAAAHLSRGVSADAFGERLATFEKLTMPKPGRDPGVINGEIVYIDHFGNLFTNLSGPDLTNGPQATVEIQLGGRFRIHGIAPAYASGVEGELVAIINSWGVLEIAAAGGNAQQRTAAKVGDPVQIREAKTFGRAE
jgi:S-adenosylmethionine hydrolase